MCELPPFWVFLACSLGEAAPDPNIIAGPEAFRVLAEKGALTMLAMRARIRVDLAEILATSLIESLAAGQSIESAAATARQAARLSRRNTKQDLWDWAAPAVWSIGRPSPKLTWGRGDGPSSVWVSVQLLRKKAAEPALGLDAAPGWAAKLASLWKTARRVRLPRNRHDPDSAFTAQIAPVLAAAASQFGCTVILIDPPRARSFTMQLSLWAQELHAQLAPASHSADVANAFKRLETGDIEGLQQLLNLPEAFIVFLEPPGQSRADEVIWEELKAAPNATIVICHDPSIEIDAMAGWTMDLLGSQSPITEADALLGRTPHSLAFLAVLDRPVSLSTVASITKEDTATLENSAILIDAPATGVVLSAQAREFVIERLGEKGVRDAHEAYLRARQHKPALISAMDDMEDLRHLIGAEHWPETAIAVNQLASARYRDWTAADWLRLERLLERAGLAHDAIDRSVLLEIAQKLVLRQDLAIARVWLENFTCESPVDEARRSALLSEVYKADTSPGARDKMWNCARRAIDLCRSPNVSVADQERARHDLRHYEQSFARLQLYFHHDAAAARAEFERLLADLEQYVEGDRHAAEVYIAAARNLAECLFEFRPFAEDEALKATAHQRLDDALKVAKLHDLTYIGAEVLYSQAKLAEAQSQFNNALIRLDICKNWALAGESATGSQTCGATG